ncbi:MAG: response regulator [Thermoplasmata archaeon]
MAGPPSGRGSPASSASSTARIRILIVDDHPVVREGVALLLRAHSSISIVGSATTAREAVRVARETQPDVILLDLRLPDRLGVEVLEELRAAVPGTKVILFTAHAEHAGVRCAIEMGLDGCLLKDATGADLAQALHRVGAGEKIFDPRISDKPTPLLKERLRTAGLSRREYEVLRMVALGKTNAEAAVTLGLTPNTVKSYLQTAMGKLGARNRVEAVARAHEQSLL